MNSKTKLVCVIGGGPAGLFTAKYLSKHFPVTIFEKSNDILGHYKYAIDQKRKIFDKIVTGRNVKLLLGKEFKMNDLSDKYFCYVDATGGIPNNALKSTLSAFDLIRDLFNSKKLINNTKLSNVTIIGMGNVSFDLLLHFKNKFKNVNILSRSDFDKSKFDISSLRKVLEYYDVSYTGNDVKSNKKISLIDKFKPCFIKKYFSNKPKLKLTFNAVMEGISENKNDKTVKYRIKNRFLKETVDNVISSIGFIPNNKLFTDIKKTDIKVFKVGWSDVATGNINDSRVNAREVSDKIIKEFK